MVPRLVVRAVFSLAVLAQILASRPSGAQGAWSPVTPMLSPRWGAAAATGADGRIYVLGGYYQGHTDTVQVYDPAAGGWTYAAPMLTARSFFKAVAGKDGRIYAFGGDGFYAGMSAAEAYSPSTNSWAPIAPMPTGRNGFGVVVLPDGRIVVMGGAAGFLTDAVEMYDPGTNTWSSRARMRHPRTQLGAALGSDGRIYAVGGGTELGPVADVDIYDPISNSWTAGPPLPYPRSDLAVVGGADGKIYAMGGGDSVIGGRNTGHVYDPASGQWSDVAPMGVGRNRPAATLGADGRIYIAGGIYQDYLNSVEAYSPEPVGGHLSVTNVNAQSGTFGALVSWTTNIPADSLVEYGPAAGIYTARASTSVRTTGHSLLLGTKPSTLYHFRVTSTDAAGNKAASPDFTFVMGYQGTLSSPVIVATYSNLRRLPNQSYSVDITYANVGNLPCTALIDGITLGTAKPLVPPPAGLFLGAPVTVTVTFPAASGSPGSTVRLATWGRCPAPLFISPLYFSSSFRVTLP